MDTIIRDTWNTLTDTQPQVRKRVFKRKRKKMTNKEIQKDCEEERGLTFFSERRKEEMDRERMRELRERKRTREREGY